MCIMCRIEQCLNGNESPKIDSKSQITHLSKEIIQDIKKQQQKSRKKIEKKEKN